MACVIFKCKSPNNNDVTIMANILLYFDNVCRIIPLNINSSNIGAKMTTLVNVKILQSKLPFNEKSGLVSGNPNFDNKAPIIPIA